MNVHLAWNSKLGGGGLKLEHWGLNPSKVPRNKSNVLEKKADF